MYAENTKVPIDRSQAEIKKTLTKYGATAFAFAEGQGNAMLMFEMQGRRIMFKLPLPSPPSKSANGTSIKHYEQICRARWRALVLCIKAKLESIESKITTLENEFMAQIVMPNGQVFGEWATPQIAQAYENKQMPPLLDMR